MGFEPWSFWEGLCIFEGICCSLLGFSVHLGLLQFLVYKSMSQRGQGSGVRCPGFRFQCDVGAMLLC